MGPPQLRHFNEAEEEEGLSGTVCVFATAWESIRSKDGEEEEEEGL